jgi:hypothetical protein
MSLIVLNKRILTVTTLDDKQLLFMYTTGTKTLDDVLNVVINKIKYWPFRYDLRNFNIKFIINETLCWPDDFAKCENKYKLLDDTDKIKFVMINTFKSFLLIVLLLLNKHYHFIQTI